MDTLTRRDRGLMMEQLTAGLSAESIAAIKQAESILCTIFKYQTVYGTERCFKLRKTLVDLYNSASPQAQGPGQGEMRRWQPQHTRQGEPPQRF